MAFFCFFKKGIDEKVSVFILFCLPLFMHLLQLKFPLGLLQKHEA